MFLFILVIYIIAIPVHLPRMAITNQSTKLLFRKERYLFGILFYIASLQRISGSTEDERENGIC